MTIWCSEEVLLLWGHCKLWCIYWPNWGNRNKKRYINYTKWIFTSTSYFCLPQSIVWDVLSMGHSCYCTWCEHGTRMKGCIFHWEFWWIMFKQSEQKLKRYQAEMLSEGKSLLLPTQKSQLKFNFPLNWI